MPDIKLPINIKISTKVVKPIFRKITDKPINSVYPKDPIKNEYLYGNLSM